MLVCQESVSSTRKNICIKKIIIRIEPDPQHCLKDVLKPLKSISVPHNQPLWFLRNKFFKCNFSSKARGSSHYEGGVGREGVRIHPRIRREHVAAYHDAPESTCSLCIVSTGTPVERSFSRICSPTFKRKTLLMQKILKTMCDQEQFYSL